ncbi:MAG: hypothetical protein UIG41_00585, partial [Gemmiger formicilis]|nr:hypothetical protein [Gemmiger formicilis]
AAKSRGYRARFSTGQHKYSTPAFHLLQEKPRRFRDFRLLQCLFCAIFQAVQILAMPNKRSRQEKFAAHYAPFIHNDDTKVTIRFSNRTKTVFFFLAHCTKNNQQACKNSRY